MGVVWSSFVLAPQLFAAQRHRPIEVPKKIVRQLMNDEDLRELIKLRGDGSAENLVAYLINLNRNGEPELVVHGIGIGICGAANCVNWIFRKGGNEYQMLLDAGSIQDIEPQKTSTNGYRDIITSMHGSAWDSDLILYKYDGEQYQRVGCFFRTYRYQDRRGRMREWKSPQITRAKCEPEQ